MAREPGGWLPALALALLLAMMVGAWLGFPRFYAWMGRNDCVAAGHADC